MQRIVSLFFILVLLTSCAWFKSEPKESESETTAESEEMRLAEAENYVSDGISYFQAGDDSMAILSWRKALEIIPEDAEVHNFLGIALHRNGDVEAALDEFKKAVSLKPDYYQAQNNMGYMLFLLNRYNAALAAFNRALGGNPGYEPAIRNRRLVESIIMGNLSREAFEISEETARKDEYIEQIDGYKKALLIDSTFAKAHNNIAVAYYYEGDLDSAMYHLQRAIHFNRNYPEAINNLAVLYKINEDYETAIKLFLKALTLKPRYIAALNNLGETYFLNKEMDNSRRVFNTVLELEPDNKVAKFWLAKMDTELNQTE
ncbi:MAG TPA: tetratricopeptide repeat protein [Caldithrix abyssi]|uniref:Tetratricopeptide repeat protein n=1 Tax=Caldithrix abyssi TaxID=187145 RepID=A0A7V4U037_CALAY|nr:tetratricopeptide repeat protein [Caldithrix abyssi]